MNTEKSSIIQARYLGKNSYFENKGTTKLLLMENNNKIHIYDNSNDKQCLVYNNIFDFLQEWTDVSTIAFTYVNRKHINNRNVYEMF